MGGCAEGGVYYWRGGCEIGRSRDGFLVKGIASLQMYNERHVWNARPLGCSAKNAEGSDVDCLNPEKQIFDAMKRSDDDLSEERRFVSDALGRVMEGKPLASDVTQMVPFLRNCQAAPFFAPEMRPPASVPNFGLVW